MNLEVADVLCRRCEHSLETGRHAGRGNLVYYGFLCRLKGSLSPYCYNVRECALFREYDVKESFMEYVKKHPKNCVEFQIGELILESQ